MVLATTGYSDEQLAQIDEASKHIPIFPQCKYVPGINVLLELVKKPPPYWATAMTLRSSKKHHNRKVDAPSGTALMIADAAASALNFKPEYVYERHSVRQSRDKKEIGISAVRGGTIVGIHEIMFAGRDEIIEIKHTAMSREIFANGAVKAAKFLAGVSKPGMYDMSMLVENN